MEDIRMHKSKIIWEKAGKTVDVICKMIERYK